MFSAPKLAKTKPLAPPSHKVLRYMNPNRKNITDLTNRAPELCNRSFDTAQTLLQRATGAKNCKQTEINFHDKENQQPSTSKKGAMGKNFFLMPLPKKTENQQHSKQKVESELQKENNNIDPMIKNGRNAIALMGKVDFCIKMYKLYPNINALWDIYGRLFKIVDGKNRFQYILLVRNPSGEGPVLQCIFYDFKNLLKQFQMGDTLRVVGRFLLEYKLQAFKVEKNSECRNADEEFSRIQNVISFALLQN